MVTMVTNIYPFSMLSLCLNSMLKSYHDKWRCRVYPKQATMFKYGTIILQGALFYLLTKKNYSANPIILWSSLLEFDFGFCFLKKRNHWTNTAPYFVWNHLFAVVWGPQRSIAFKCLAFESWIWYRAVVLNGRLFFCWIQNIHYCCWIATTFTTGRSGS